MKLKNARKLTALLLALVMILPIISIPAMAESSSTKGMARGSAGKPAALYYQDFDEHDLGKSTAVKGPSSAMVIEGPDGRGNVLQIDCKAIGNENLFYVHFNNDRNTWVAITDVRLSSTSIEVKVEVDVEYQVEVLDPETGEPVIDPETGEVMTKTEIRKEQRTELQEIPYLTGRIEPVAGIGAYYFVEGIVNNNYCQFEVKSVTDANGAPVEYKDIIVKGHKEENMVDENGDIIWVPVLDENGNQVIGEILDENGKVKMFPVMIDKVDENGNVVLGPDGQPEQVQKTEPAFDENGNPIMDPVSDPDTGRPVYKRDPETGKVLRDENGIAIVETKQRELPVYESRIGEVKKTIKIKVNDPSKFLATSAYITTEAFKDAYGGGTNNIATPAAVQHPAIKGDVLVFTTDYFFSAAVEDDPETLEIDESVDALTRGLDVRVEANYQYLDANGKIATKKKVIDFMSIATPSNGKITLRAHESDAKTPLVAGTKTIDLGTWVNIIIVADLRSGTYLIYVDGELMCVRQDADLSTGTPNTSHWEGPCVSINANTWNIGHFTRGGKVEDYKGYMQIDNVAIYDGSKLNELFDYYGYSKEFDEDYESYEIGKVLDTYFNGSSPKATVEDVNGNKVAAIDLSYAGNVDANFKPHNNAVTYVDSKTVVLESDYFLTEDAVVKFQSQIHNIGAHPDIEGSPFSSTLQGSSKTYQWIDLYTVNATDATANTATVSFMGATIPDGETTAPTVTIKKGIWNTFSTVINLEDGSYTFYVNGVYAIEGRLAKLINNVAYNFKDISFGKDQWIAAKVMKGDLARKGTLYLDELMVTELGGGKAEVMLVEAMLSADIYANGEFYKTVTHTNRFYKSSDIEIQAEVFDLKEQTGTDQLLTMVGASLRFTSPTGLRFASKVDLDALNALYAMVGDEEGDINLQSVTFGTLIIPTDILGDKDLTFEVLEKEEITDYLNIPGTKDYYYDLDDDETTTHICGSILNLKESNIDRLFTGVNYVRIILPNGIEYNIYSDRDFRASAQSVADDAWGEYTPAEQAVIDAFLAGVKPEADTQLPPPPVDDDTTGGDGNDDGDDTTGDDTTGDDTTGDDATGDGTDGDDDAGDGGDTGTV